ncbi:hypothetical protein N9D23_06355 [Rubripirellula sp.]|jgi:Tfp pilus assembly protein FimT|nr:hypothetical protein [Rubripirellula sp.]MDF1840749.1 hypothetical protein [Rubripirellula sp.]
MPLDRRGMSTIELVRVVMLVGSLPAVATPRFAESLRATQFETAAHQLAAHIGYLRSAAINQGRTITLSCDNEAATYQCDSSVRLLSAIPLISPNGSAIQSLFRLPMSTTPRSNCLQKF